MATDAESAMTADKSGLMREVTSGRPHVISLSLLRAGSAPSSNQDRAEGSFTRR